MNLRNIPDVTVPMLFLLYLLDGGVNGVGLPLEGGVTDL